MNERRYSKHRVRWSFLAVTITVATCLALAVWQFQRGQSKAELSSKENQRLAVSTLLSVPLASAHGATLNAEGQWLKEHYWLLDNQIVNGQPGYDLLVPFKLTAGPILVINLGFVAASAPRLPPKALPSFAKLPENLAVTLKTKDLKGFSLASSPEQEGNMTNLIQYIDPSYFSNALGAEVFTAIGYAEHAYSDELTHHFSLSVMPAQKHYAYALQWLLLAVAAVLVAYFKLKTEQRSVADEK